MTTHAEDSLRSARISQILNLSLAVATPETARTERLVAGEDGKVFYLIATRAATVRAVVTYKRAIAQEEEVRVGVEEGAAGVASEAVNVPSIAS